MIIKNLYFKGMCSGIWTQWKPEVAEALMSIPELFIFWNGFWRIKKLPFLKALWKMLSRQVLKIEKFKKSLLAILDESLYWCYWRQGSAQKKIWSEPGTHRNPLFWFRPGTRNPLEPKYYRLSWVPPGTRNPLFDYQNTGWITKIFKLSERHEILFPRLLFVADIKTVLEIDKKFSV